MSRQLLIFIAMCYVLVVSPQVTADEQIIVCGTGDGSEVFESLARAFEIRHPGKSVTLPPSIDSGGGIKATARGQCALGRVARPPRGREKKYNLVYKVIAYTPIVFALHSSVTRPGNLTTGQLLDLLSGKIANWKALGGPDASIYIVQRQPGDATREILRKTLPGIEHVNDLEGYVAYTAREAVDSIKTHRFTIGYISLKAAIEANLTIVKVNGAYPSTESIQAGAYKLVIPLGFVWKDPLHGTAREFLEFSIGNEGKKAIRATGAVPAL